MRGLYSNEPFDLILDFQEQTQITFPLVDGRSSLRAFDFPAGVGYPYPRDVVVDKELRVRAIRNSFDIDEMQVLIEQLLAE